jgi:hypothetical protein
LPAIAVGRVVTSAQGHILVGDDLHKRSAAQGGWLDGGEPDLAAVGKTKTAAIDDLSDAAFALRLEGAAGCVRRRRRGEERWRA